MTPSQKQKIVAILQNSKGDDTARAKLAFKNYTSAQMKNEWGISGKSCNDILNDYLKHDAEIVCLIDAVKTA